MERAEAASVSTGQTIFEIGSLQPLRIEVAVPAEEVAQIKSGLPVTAWIDGREDTPVTGTLEKIRPRSETRDARNVFIAEFRCANQSHQLRPGMEGTVRIDGERRSLGWTLFHKPWDYLRSRFTFW